MQAGKGKKMPRLATGRRGRPQPLRRAPRPGFDQTPDSHRDPLAPPRAGQVETG